MLSHDHRGPPGAEQAGHVGQRMRMMHVDDVGPLPCRRDVAGGDFLRAERGKRECPGDRGPLAGGAAGPASALDGHDLYLVAELGRAFGQALDHPFHAAGARPVVLRQVENAHGESRQVSL
jgi:hypothetical protein